MCFVLQKKCLPSSHSPYSLLSTSKELIAVKFRGLYSKALSNGNPFALRPHAKVKSAHRYLPPYLVKQATQTRAQWGVGNHQLTWPNLWKDEHFTHYKSYKCWIRHELCCFLQACLTWSSFGLSQSPSWSVAVLVSHGCFCLRWHGILLPFLLITQCICGVRGFAGYRLTDNIPNKSGVTYTASMSIYHYLIVCASIFLYTRSIKH